MHGTTVKKKDKFIFEIVWVFFISILPRKDTPHAVRSSGLWWGLIWIRYSVLCI